MGEEERYWSQRYQEGNTGWDMGLPSPPLTAYLDQLDDKHLDILFPGAGNAYEGEYAFLQGFKQVHLLDIAREPLDNVLWRIPEFPVSQLIQKNFFEFSGQFDLILEQTFFCALVPSKENRRQYAQKMAELLKPGGKLVGLWWDFPLSDDWTKRPFGGSKEEYLGYFTPFFRIDTFESCYNSAPPRMGREFFARMTKI